MRILLIVLIGFTLACKSKKGVAEKAKPLSEEVQEELIEKPQIADEASKKKSIDFPRNAIARIQRTACYGRCPIYTLTVYSDGSVLYEAQKWVKEEGTFQGKANPEKFQQLLNKANEIGFFELKDEYDSEYVTDLPSVITTLRSDDVLKQVVNRYQGPEKLSEFEKYFDTLYLELQWSKQDE